MMKEPWLIQRIMIKEFPRDQCGIDAYFAFDYMGSAEFEFGALFEALKSMRRQPNLVSPRRIKDEKGRVAWYVGPDNREILAYAKKLLNDQNGDRSLRFKDPTMMDRRYHPRDNFDTQRAPIGWWAIDQEQPWLLFYKKDDAKEWISRMSPALARGSH